VVDAIQAFQTTGLDFTVTSTTTSCSSVALSRNLRATRQSQVEYTTSLLAGSSAVTSSGGGQRFQAADPRPVTRNW
jgi:hypothetical protein